MTEYTILYNPHAANGRGEESAKRLASVLGGSGTEMLDMTKLGDYADFFADLPPARPVVICGGDGTLNRFINDTEGLDIKNSIYYFAGGSGNDFMRDAAAEQDEVVPMTEYLRDLPQVTVKGRTYRFLNGVGYGIDGYCCQVGDRLRAASEKPVNYTAIAVKGLLFHYKPTGAVITVDGKKHTYKKVWLAPTMNGRYYGGGMMPAPEQDRLSGERTVSVMVLHGSGKLKTLMVFPSIFKGGHVKHTEMVEVLSGSDINVQFDRPTPLQIDGETITDVMGYQVTTSRVWARV